MLLSRSSGEMRHNVSDVGFRDEHNLHFNVCKVATLILEPCSRRETPSPLSADGVDNHSSQVMHSNAY